jgi:hypothetical protein
VGLLHEALPPSTLVVAIDPGKVSNRVWLSSGEAGPVVPPLSLPVLRPGLDQLHRLVTDHTGPRRAGVRHRGHRSSAPGLGA